MFVCSSTFFNPNSGFSVDGLLRDFDDGRHADLVDFVPIGLTVTVDITSATTVADLTVGAFDLKMRRVII